MSCSNYKLSGRKWISLFLFVCCVVILQAQEEARPFTDIARLQQRMKEQAAGMKTIEADMVQEKYLSFFKDKITSKGKFYFKKEDKIRLEYFSPVAHVMILNGTKIKTISDGKSNTIQLGSNPMMKEIKVIISACMTGDLGNISGAYNINYSETSDTYIIDILPKAKSIQAYIKEMKVILDKKDITVIQLRITDGGEDYTDYVFTNRQYNIEIPDEKFDVN